MANNYENIEKLGGLQGEIGKLSKSVSESEKQLSALLKKLGDMESAIFAKRAAEEAEKQAPVQAEAEAVEPTPAPVEKKSKRKEPQQEEPKEKPVEKAEPTVAEKPAEEPKEKPVEKAAEKPVEEPKEKADASKVYQSEKPADRPSFIVARSGERQTYGPRTANGTYRAGATTRQGEKPTFTRPQGDRPPRDRNGVNGRPMQGQNGAHPTFTRPAQGQNGARPTFAPRTPAARPVAPTPAPTQRREFTGTKKFEKTYTEKRPVSKRALIRQQGADIDDFDENKSGYRKARFAKKGVKKETQTIRIEHAVVTSKDIPIKTLSEKLGISAVEITKRLFREGVMKTVNESIDYDNAAFIALELGIDLEYKPEKTAEDALFEAHGADGAENEVLRAPIVTVMGHVDHGKTSLLDRIRATNVTAGEAGGITQNIGAYTVSFGEGKKITFIDTPGHAAFTAMRARGAQVTDIVVLVVAADDGIMPQTVEAINHAKAANVPIIVAMNKMDKPHVNPDRVKQGLLEHNLVPEEWGGDTMLVPVSAKTGEGIEDLLENISLVAEMQELKANPDRMAKGVIIEAKLDKGKGPMASVLVQNGTLRTGDNLISGTTMGRVRAMIDDKGRTVKEAGPSTAVSVLGLEDVPNAGDQIFAVEQSLMKQVQEERKNRQRESMIKEQTKVTLDDVFAQVAEGKMKELNIIVKGDVQGSVEAVRQAVEKLSNEEVKVKVIHSAAGAITESDIMLAESSAAIVIGFNVRPDSKAKTLAERSKVDVRMYRIIYELLDDMEAALKGMLSPKYQEIYMGKCEVRQTFNITGVGTIAGCYVTEGKLIRGGKLRIYRDDVMIVEGNVKQLKRFKDDVKEVSFGFECGCAIEGFNEIKVGDFIECYMIEEIKQA